MIYSLICDVSVREEGTTKIFQGLTPALYRHIGNLNFDCIEFENLTIYS